MWIDRMPVRVRLPVVYRPAASGTGPYRTGRAGGDSESAAPGPASPRDRGDAKQLRSPSSLASSPPHQVSDAPALPQQARLLPEIPFLPVFFGGTPGSRRR
jgi:hypothetical protein